jgi:hypothetical protein
MDLHNELVLLKGEKPEATENLRAQSGQLLASKTSLEERGKSSYPVVPLILYMAFASRAEIKYDPSSSLSTELIWK